MNKYYFRFRILLMTFALGLASVFVFNGSLQSSSEVFVNLPKVKSESSFIIIPIENKNIDFGSYGCGYLLPIENHKKKRLKIENHKKKRLKK
jgi:hypothetical protein